MLEPEWLKGCREVLEMVRQERIRERAQYGDNADLEDGTGPDVDWSLTGNSATLVEKVFRREYELTERRTGKPTWMQLVREEIAEAFQEKDDERRETELIQVAALCVSWVEISRKRRE